VIDVEVLLFRPRVPAEEDCCGVTVVVFLWLFPGDLAWLSAWEFWGFVLLQPSFGFVELSVIS